MSKAGRPKSENPKGIKRQVRLTAAQDEYLQARADEAGQDFSEYVREQLLPECLR